MSIEDHVKSKKNLDLVKAFACKKLYDEWPKQKKDVEKAIDLCLNDSIDSIIDTYVKWSVTPANIAEINVHVWRALKQNVIHAMKGHHAESDDVLAAMLERRGPPHAETKVEGVMSEHENEYMRDKYLEAWST